MHYTQTLAHWIATAPAISDPAVINQASQSMIDIVACMIPGLKTKEAQACLHSIKLWGCGDSNIWTGDYCADTPIAYPAPNPALVNGTAAHALDFDDNFITAFTHATAVLAPALFALADQHRYSGQKILDAYIVGLELQARIGRIVNPNHYSLGWHATATIGTIGTAGACARLLGLNESQCLAALSISTSLASGSKKQFGNMLKPVHAGIAAKHAVEACALAASGITGDEEPFFGTWGFVELFSDVLNSATPPDSTSADVDFNKPLAIETYGLHVKRFPCCGSAHRALDAIEILQNETEILAENIERVEIKLSDIEYANLRYIHPQNVMEARFSMHHCASQMLLNGSLRLKDLSHTALNNPQVSAMIKRIQVSKNKVSERKDDGKSIPGESQVTLVLKNGTRLTSKVVMPKGSIDAPLSLQDLWVKFTDCTSGFIHHDDATKLFDKLASFREIKDFKIFSNHLNKVIYATALTPPFTNH